MRNCTRPAPTVLENYSKSLVSPYPSPCGHSLRVLVFKCCLCVFNVCTCASISLMHKSEQSPLTSSRRQRGGGNLSQRPAPARPPSESVPGPMLRDVHCGRWYLAQRPQLSSLKGRPCGFLLDTKP